MNRGLCLAPGCRHVLLEREALCARHLAMLQDATRTLLLQKFRPGKPKQSAIFTALLRTALAEIAFYERVGHRVPVEQPLPLEGALP